MVCIMVEQNKDKNNVYDTLRYQEETNFKIQYLLIYSFHKRISQITIEITSVFFISQLNQNYNWDDVLKRYEFF